MAYACKFPAPHDPVMLVSQITVTAQEASVAGQFTRVRYPSASNTSPPPTTRFPEVHVAVALVTLVSVVPRACVACMISYPEIQLLHCPPTKKFVVVAFPSTIKFPNTSRLGSLVVVAIPIPNAPSIY